MKKLLMMMGMTFVCAACGQNGTELKYDSQQAQSDKKVLVAYFSFTNNTKVYAEKIAQMTGGELYEIVPAEAYGGENSNYYDEGTRAYKEQYNTGGEQRPAIEETLENSSQYGVVFLGSPICYGKSPRVILSFLDKYGFRGKTVIPFVTSMASGISRVNDELPATYPGIRWIEGRRLNGVSDASLQTWIDGILRTTAVSGIVADGSQHYNVYSLSDKRMLTNVSTLESLPASIYIINGKKTIIK